MSPTTISSNDTFITPISPSLIPNSLNPDTSDIIFFNHLNHHSTLSDQDLFLHPLEHDTKKQNDWHALISKFESEPEMLHLIESCKIQEEKRRQEESKVKLKEYQVMCQLNYLNRQAKSI